MHIYRHRELGDSKWSAVFAQTIVINDREHGRDLEGFWAVWRGVLLQHKKELAVTRLSVGVPNDLQMERILTGGLPVVYQGHLSRLGPFPERSTPAHEKKTRGVRRWRWECRIARRTTGKMLGCMRRTRMQMRCT